MATQMLIYESAVPISKSRHAKHSLEAGADYGFARNVNSLPLTAVEILPAAGEYPVVFAGDANAVMPAAILGMRDKENAFLDARGKWLGQYIPAFARRYPFVFSSQDQGQDLTVCIDESFQGLNTEGRGQRLFDDDGKPTPYVENVLKFLQQYQVEFQRTQQFCNRLKELDLFEPMQAQVDLGEQGRVALSGFMAVNRAKLRDLPPEVLSELAKNDSLELIYAQLHSMRHFVSLRERMMGAKSAAAKTPVPAAASSTGPVAEQASAEGGRKSKADKEQSGGGKKR